MKKLLSLLAAVGLTSIASVNMVACGNNTEIPQPNEKRELSEVLKNTNLVINNLNLITNSDELIITAIKYLNPELNNKNIQIQNKTLTTALISSTDFSGEVLVTMDAFFDFNLNIGIITSDKEIIDKINEQIPAAAAFNFDIESINVSTWNQTEHSFNRIITISSVSFFGTASINSTINNQEFSVFAPNPIQAYGVLPSPKILQLDDGRIIIAEGSGASSFLMSLDLSGTTPETEVLIESNFVPDWIGSMIQLDDGRILIAGVYENSFLMSLDLSGATPETEILTNDFVPSRVESMVQLDDGSLIVVGDIWSEDRSFIWKVNLEHALPEVNILVENDFILNFINDMILLDDGRILIAGHNSYDYTAYEDPTESSFLMSLDLSGATPETEILIENNFVPSWIGSMIQLDDGRVFVTGGTDDIFFENESSNSSFLMSLDLSGEEIQTEMVVDNNFYPNNDFFFANMFKLADGRIVVSSWDLLGDIKLSIMII